MGTRDEYIKSMKSAFVSIGTRLAVSWVAYLFGGVTLHPLIEKFISHFANKFFIYLADKTEMGAFFFYIDTRVAGQASGFEAAALHNWRVQQNGTDAEKAFAEKILWERFKIFAHLKS